MKTLFDFKLRINLSVVVYRELFLFVKTEKRCCVLKIIFGMFLIAKSLQK